jgi:hypothetical protein
MGSRAKYDPPAYVSRGPLDDPKYAAEVSEFFLDGMRSRMGVSFYKYGPVANGFPEKVEALASMHGSLKKYADTGNAEFLMDAANYAMIEFMHPSRADAHFRATDSDESPGRIEKVSGEAVHFANRDIFA